MTLIDADELIRDRVENDPIRIALECAPTAFDKERVIEELTLHKKIADYKTQEFDEAGDVRNMEIQDFFACSSRRN